MERKVFVVLLPRTEGPDLAQCPMPTCPIFSAAYYTLLHCLRCPMMPQATYAGGERPGRASNSLTAPLPKQGEGNVLHTPCVKGKGGCMQPYGSGDSCNVA